MLRNTVTGYVQNGERQTGDQSLASLGHVVLILIAADRYLTATLGSVFPENCQSPVSELSPYNTYEDNSFS